MVFKNFSHVSRPAKVKQAPLKHSCRLPTVMVDLILDTCLVLPMRSSLLSKEKGKELGVRNRKLAITEFLQQNIIFGAQTLDGGDGLTAD
jgi:hypothetical protein